VMSDLCNVFEIGPVFRAENSNTHRHMCEFVGLDFEMEIKEHYHEILLMLGNLFVHIFDNINKHCQAELAAIHRQYPFRPLRYRPKNQTLVLDFREIVTVLQEAGERIGPTDDLSTPQEKKLGVLVGNKHNTDFYIWTSTPPTCVRSIRCRARMTSDTPTLTTPFSGARRLLPVPNECTMWTC